MLVLSLSSGQAMEQRLHRYALGPCMHLQSEHIAVVSMLLHLRAVHLIMRELTEGLDVLNGHHLLCPMQSTFYLLSEGISICQKAYLFDTFRYLSRVPQHGLTIMLLLSPLAGQATLQLCPQLRYVLCDYTSTFQSVIALLQNVAVHHT